MTAEDKFVAGETYSLEIKLSQKKDGNAIMTSFQTPVTAYLNGQMVSSSDVTANTTTIYVFATFECEAAPGVTVSGTVTSFNDATSDVTIELYREGEATAAFSTVVKGNNASYSIEGVDTGVYTVKISKANHVTREYTITVGTENVTQNAKIHLKGDINGDGRVNITDVGLANAHAKKTSTLTDYAYACANVNGDSRVNISDVGLLNAHAKKTATLW